MVATWHHHPGGETQCFIEKRRGILSGVCDGDERLLWSSWRSWFISGTYACYEEDLGFTESWCIDERMCWGWKECAKHQGLCVCLFFPFKNEGNVFCHVHDQRIPFVLETHSFYFEKHVFLVLKETVFWYRVYDSHDYSNGGVRRLQMVGMW